MAQPRDSRTDFGATLRPTTCSKCGKFTRNRGCGGCNKIFCRTHYTEHVSLADCCCRGKIPFRVEGRGSGGGCKEPSSGEGQNVGEPKYTRTESGRIRSFGGTLHQTLLSFTKAQRIKKFDAPVERPVRFRRSVPPKSLKQDVDIATIAPAAENRVGPVLGPETVGNLACQQIKGDNSCLFSAVMKAVGDDREAMALRQGAIPDYLTLIPQEYFNVEADGLSRERYAQWIKLPESWGGSLELYILSRYYGVQICVVDVKQQTTLLFPEQPPTRKNARIYLLYNGVHYDCVGSDGDTQSRGVFSAIDKRTELRIIELAPYFATTMEQQVS